MTPKPTTKLYCCPAHALCDVDVPGSVGRRAREWYKAHKDDEPEWCGYRGRLTGQVILAARDVS